MTDITSTVTDLLPLEAIHLPEPPGFWPVAWGWWSLILAVFLSLGFAVLLWKWRKKKMAPKKAAIALLTLEQETITPSGAMEIVRQAALSYYPRDRVAHLSGTKWLDFLDSQLGSAVFMNNEQEWLSALYEKNPSVDPQALIAQCHQWLKSALPPKRGGRE